MSYRQSGNLATERATVCFSGALTQDDFRTAVEAARRARELRDLKVKFIASAAVS